MTREICSACGRVSRVGFSVPDDVPCADCGDEVFANAYRHEYDHFMGYAAQHHETVQAVCSKCHHSREELRRVNAN